jgi:hypothetical protein
MKKEQKRKGQRMKVVKMNTYVIERKFNGTVTADQVIAKVIRNHLKE